MKPLLLALAIVQGDAPTPPPKLDLKAFASFQQLQPGCAAAFSEQGKITQSGGFGSADTRAKIALDADTTFYTASVSKSFTAMAVAQLIVAGKISRHDDVRRWIPELRVTQTPITVDHLLHHTSGLRDFLELLALAGVEDFDQLDQATALRIIADQQGGNFEPGARYSYSNTGYFLLAQIVERASGQAFADYQKRHILEPLGMTRSYFRGGAPPEGLKVAHGYAPQGKGFALDDHYPGVSGSGGLMSTPADLLKYANDALAGGKVWTPAVSAILLEPGHLANGAEVREPALNLAYAGGVMIGQRRGEDIVSHGGRGSGFSAELIWLPGPKVAGAALCNRPDAGLLAKMNATLAPYFGPVGAGAPSPALTNAAPSPQSTSDLTLLEGSWRSEELRAHYAIRRWKNGLEVSVTSPYRQGEHRWRFDKMVAMAPDAWKADGYSFSLTRDAYNQISGFALSGPRTSRLVFQKAGR